VIFFAVNITMDFLAFSHGQMHSKLWLCENLEPYIQDSSVAAILGSWYNILGWMLLVRNPNKFKFLEGYDIDHTSIQISDNILAAWKIGHNHIVNNFCKNVNETSLDKYDLVINCSPEHMSKQSWFTNCKHQLICIQTTDVDNSDPVWDIKHPIKDLTQLKSKYPMSQILFEGEKVFDYGHFSYKRFMLIGYK
jgi:hypothetical protein